MMKRRFTFAVLVLAAVCFAAGGSGRDAARAGSFPTPLDTVTGDTPPPLDATATPVPEGNIVRYAGQLLDDRSGYVFFTTGDGFRLAQHVKIIDAQTGGPTKLLPATRTYARAGFDRATGQVVELALSSKKLPDDASYDSVKKFAVALSTPYANPDLQPRPGFNGKGVQVTFIVEVPSRTPFSDQIFIATDQSGWSATAIRMDRVDALHYRVEREVSSGENLLYRYTRGSWRSAELGQNGIQLKPRVLAVRNSDVQVKRDIVYAWGDQDEFSPDLSGGGAPTPFNVNPFPFQPGGPAGAPPSPARH